MVSSSARRILRSRQWDALADIEVFIFATEAELEAMDAERGGFISAVADRIVTCGDACWAWKRNLALQSLRIVGRQVDE
jgi:hypothetical protein